MSSTVTIQGEIERYLRTGEHDMLFGAWPGDLLHRAQQGNDDLRRALVNEVQQGCKGKRPPANVPEMDLTLFTRSKLEPMVRGLFPQRERDVILDLLENSVVFLAPDRIGELLRATHWPSTAWDLANLYLGSVGAELLGENAQHIVGLSEETTCYVSTVYFTEEDRFADFVVHEAAHIFHNCKRRTAGLPETRTREWLLDIDFGRRETFAYACETYSRILELGTGPAARRSLLAEVESQPVPNDDRVDASEYLDVLREAIEARNGWKRILGRCAPPRQVPGSVELEE